MTTHYCNTCGGQCWLLGMLGSLCWWRCRDCGCDQHHTVEVEHE